MNVVLLTYYFPPAPEVGALRATRIANSFLERDFQVHVVTGPLPLGQTSPSAADGLTVHRIAPAVDLRALWNRRRAAGHAGSDGGAATGQTVWKPPARTPFLKRQISAALWLPDDRQAWIRPAAKRATELVRRGPSILYSSAPPFSVHLAALLVKRRTGVRWVLEFRDPWTDNPSKPEFVRTAWSDAAERWLERRALRAADLTVTVTESLAGVLRNRQPAGGRNRVALVRNGIVDLDPPRTGAVGPRRRIVYLGNLYHTRDPRPFLNAMAELRREGRLIPGLRIEFIGDCRWLLGLSMEGAVRQLGLEDLVTFIDPLPHDESLRRIRDADLLLLLAREQPLQVPNKLYEYLGVRRPVLAFVDAAGETARMLELLGGHYIVTGSDAATTREIVLDALSGPPQSPGPATETLLEEWSADNQLRHLHAHMESVRQ